MKDILNLKKTDVGERKVEITAELSSDKFYEYFQKALKKFKDNVAIDGFRKGFAPEDLVLKQVGDMVVLEEASSDALNDFYPMILDELKLDAIGRPEIKITKIAKNNPLGFAIITYLSPIIKISDYKKIAKEKNSKKADLVSVEEKEVDDVVLNLRKNIAHQKMHEKAGLSQDDHSHGEIKDEDLPKIDEEFLKNFGDFKTEKDLREKIKENVLKEKEFKAKDKKRVELLEALISATEIEMPEVLVFSELDKMLAEFKNDINMSGISYEDYLKHIKKTEEDLKNEWMPTAKTRAKTQLFLFEVSKIENIKPKEEDIKKEVDHIVANIKDADRFRARMYVENFLTNDLVIKFLEGIE
jgi:trigger factor